MKYQTIIYRTPDSPHNLYAVLPMIFVYSFTQWVVTDKQGEVIRTADHPHKLPDVLAPQDWPNLSQCKEYTDKLALVALTGLRQELKYG